MTFKHLIKWSRTTVHQSHQSPHCICFDTNQRHLIDVMIARDKNRKKYFLTDPLSEAGTMRVRWQRLAQLRQHRRDWNKDVPVYRDYILHVHALHG